MTSSDHSRPPTAVKAETPSPVASASTDVTTPSPSNEFFDDVFGSAPPSPTAAGTTPGDVDGDAALSLSSTPGGVARREFSDITRLRSIHTTAGYRDGLSEAKEQALQPGFDEGYSLGAALGVRAGLIAGIIEGLPDAIVAPEGSDLPNKLLAMARQCREELLGPEMLLADEYIDLEGLWRWPTPADADVHQVAAAHPLVSKWQRRLDFVCDQLGIGARKLEERWVEETPTLPTTEPTSSTSTVKQNSTPTANGTRSGKQFFDF